MSARSIIPHVRRTLASRQLVSPGDRVLVAVSGGADSVALLHLLVHLAPEFDLTLTVAHLDHGLRGAASAADARFVANLAVSLDLPCLSRRVDARTHARQSGASLEMAARELRYRFLAEAARAAGASRVATAHTADDLAETVLLFLVRGAGDRGLRGFPWRRTLAPGVELIRPLRDTRRDEILAYLASRKLPFRTDATNRDRRIPRNRVRAELLPLLEQRFNPQAVRALCRAADRWEEAENLLGDMAQEALEAGLRERQAGKIVLDGRVLARYSNDLRGRVLRAAWRLLSPEPLSESHTASLLGVASGHRGGSGLPGGHRARLEGRLLVIESAAPRRPNPQVAIPLSVPGLTVLAAPGEESPSAVSARLLEASERPDRGDGQGERRAALDWQAIVPPLVARHPREGDRMRPLGMKGTKKLQDLLVDRKIPRARRRALWLVEDRRRILWVMGVAMSDDVKLGPRTKRLLLLEEVEA